MCSIQNTECCGVDEMYSLERPDKDIECVCENLMRGEDCAIYLFHDAVKYQNGARLARYIKKHELGAVVATRSVNNPNSGRNIKAWLWTPNKKALKAWYKKHKHESK